MIMHCKNGTQISCLMLRRLAINLAVKGLGHPPCFTDFPVKIVTQVVDKNTPEYDYFSYSSKAASGWCSYVCQGAQPLFIRPARSEKHVIGVALRNGCHYSLNWTTGLAFKFNHFCASYVHSQSLHTAGKTS